MKKRDYAHLFGFKMNLYKDQFTGKARETHTLVVQCAPRKRCIAKVAGGAA